MNLKLFLTCIARRAIKYLNQKNRKTDIISYIYFLTFFSFANHEKSKKHKENLLLLKSTLLSSEEEEEMIKPSSPPPQNEDTVTPVHTDTTAISSSIENNAENPLTVNPLSIRTNDTSIDVSGSVSPHLVIQDCDTDSSNEREKEEDIQLLQSRPIK